MINQLTMNGNMCSLPPFPTQEPVRFRKGTVLWRKRYEPHGVAARDDLPSILSENIDIITDEFWTARPDLLAPYIP